MNIRRYFLITFLYFTFTALYAQTFEIANQIKSTEHIGAYLSKVDKNGNIYIAAGFTGTAIFPDTTLIEKGNRDIALAKYDSLGTFKWARTFGGPYIDEVTAISLDDSGNCYLTGRALSPALIDGIHIPGKGFSDMLIVKYSPEGVLKWYINEGGEIINASRGLAIDKNHNVYVCGYFDQGFFGNNPLLESKGPYDLYIAKYDINGKSLWLKTFGGLGSEIPSGLAMDSSDNMYLMGYFDDTLKFNKFQLTAKGGDENFITKFNTNGEILESKKIPESLNQFDGKLYHKGKFLYTIHNYRDPVRQNFVSNLRKLTLEGNVVMSKSFNESPNVSISDITFDTKGNQYITGFFKDSLLIDGLRLIGSGNTMYIMCLNPDNKILWGKSFDEVGSTVGSSINYFKKNRIYITGTVSDEIHLDNFHFRDYNRNGSFGFFGIMVDTTLSLDPGNITQISNEFFPTDSKAYWVNNKKQQTFTVYISESYSRNTISIIDLFGRKVKTNNLPERINEISLHDLEEGLYLVHIQDFYGNVIKSGKLLIE